jgi:type 1 glutamine amidotransferase
MGGDDNTFHNFEHLLPIIREQLTTLDLDVVVSEDPDMFLRENIRDFHLVICYTFGHTLTVAQEEGLLEALQGDVGNHAAKTRGFIGIHGASNSFLNSDAYLEMLGGRFLEHPPLGTIRAEIKPPDHPVTSGVGDFSIEDELYLLELCSSFEVLVACRYEGSERPLVWVKPYGSGKVVYISLGHGEQQLRHPSFTKILVNAARWVAGN